jgi:hypothetical protein
MRFGMFDVCGVFVVNEYGACDVTFRVTICRERTNYDIQKPTHP